MPTQRLVLPQLHNFSTSEALHAVLVLAAAAVLRAERKAEVLPSSAAGAVVSLCAAAYMMEGLQPAPCARASFLLKAGQSK